MVEFSKTGVFEYRRAAKLRFAIISLAVIVFILLLVAAYFLFLQDQELLIVDFLIGLISHVQGEISAATPIGVLYTALFGGLFFVTLPMEAIYIKFLSQGVSTPLLLVTYIFGFGVAFTLNYIIGLKLNAFSKKLVGPQKFYKLKGVLNRHGAVAVLVINLIPFFPAQPLSAILGVFRYNKAKFYVYSLGGQAVKYLVMAIAYLYIFA
ncbi:MAG: VTT domain-containing protein [Candidatus Woesearchaeota archaeon]